MLGPWGCVLALWSVSQHHAAFCVVFCRCCGTSLGAPLFLLNQEKFSPKSKEGRGWVFHGTHHVPGTDGLFLGMLHGSDSIADDVF